MRRCFDVVVSTFALVGGAPFLGLLAAAVKLDSAGPAIFVQTRIGRGRRPFKLYKLRTMRADHVGGAQITASADSRITRVGRLLRRAKLDEVPQLVNVLCGEMSIVGPRPEVPRYVELYRPEWLPLLEVRPGLTDLASLTFRHEEQLLAMARDRDRAYVEIIMPLKLSLAASELDRRSLWYDLVIIARTAYAVVRPRPLGEDPLVREAMRLIAAQNEEVGN